MDISLYQAAAGMDASARWQEVIADNLSAASIPGFKKQELSFSAVQSGYSLTGQNAAAGSRQRFVMPTTSATTNFEAGEMRNTGVSTDLAIEGSGFFEVQMPDGTRAYTRDGEFHVSAQRQLVTKRGLPVMGDTGPVQLDLNSSASFTIAPTGEITQAGQAKGRLKMVEFNSPNALAPTGTGYFAVSDPNLQPSASSKSSVHQGFLEAGNTSTLMEMGNLITAMRLYEANQKVLQTQDDRTSRLINDVASPT
jgi:flagellar basal body rod protein FlgG